MSWKQPFTRIAERWRNSRLFRRTTYLLFVLIGLWIFRIQLAILVLVPLHYLIDVEQFLRGQGPIAKLIASLGPEGTATLCRLGSNKVTDYSPADYSYRQTSSALNALQSIRDPKQQALLIAVVQNDKYSESVRISAMRALCNNKSGSIGATQYKYDPVFDSRITLPFIISVLKNNGYPLSIRNRAAEILPYFPDSSVDLVLCELSTDSDPIHLACLITLAKKSPQGYLSSILSLIIDPTRSMEDRMALVNRLNLHLSWTTFGWISRKDKITSAEKDLFMQAIRAKTKDGKPADELRLAVWIAYSSAAEEEPKIELSEKTYKPPDEIPTDLWNYINGKFIEKEIYGNFRYGYEKKEQMIRDRLNEIVTVWKPGQPTSQ